MPKVLLISVNRETAPYPVFPIGVWVLHNYLVERGVDVDIADLFLLSQGAESQPHSKAPSPTASHAGSENQAKANEDTTLHEDDAGLDALEVQYLRRQSYDVVGLSLRNIDNLTWLSSVDYRPEIAACVERVKRCLGPAKIVAGGAGYSIFGEELLNALGLEDGVAGDGEQALLRMVSKTKLTPPAPDFSFSQRVPVDVLRRYYRESGMIGLQSRRGCPFECSYCTYPQIEGMAMRNRDPASVIAEIRLLREQHGIDVFYFVDCNFNYPPGYTRELLQCLAAAKTGAHWYAFVNPGHFDVGLARLMKSAGCAGIEFGSESGDPLMLQTLNKHYSPDQLLAASRACREVGLKFCHYLLLGAPGETLESVAATLRLMKACDPATVSLSIGVRIYPGTSLARDLVRQGSLDPAQSLLPPVFHHPEKITLPEILEYCHAHAPRHWILPGRGDQEMAERMKLLRRCGARGPLWDYL